MERALHCGWGLQSRVPDSSTDDEGRGWSMAAAIPQENFPQCRKCDSGSMLPLSDYGRDGAPITYKAWVCSNPECGFNIRIDNGEISFGRTIGQSYK
jgi:hypothetical protein